jgi:hypothetical protein
MLIKTRPLFVLITLLAALSVPSIVHGAGGRIEGKVTDPKGAAVAGASVTITEEANDQRFTAVTDAQGRYKVEGLPRRSLHGCDISDGFRRSAKGISQLG